MKTLKLFALMLCAVAAFASNDVNAPVNVPGDDRGPVRTLDDQCVIDFQGYVYGTHSGTTQWPGGSNNFRLAMFCFTTSNCPDLPSTFYTYCTDMDHALQQDPYCVDIEDCIVDPLYPTVTPAMAYVLTNFDVVDAQTDRIKQLAVWKLSTDRSGGVNDGIPYVHTDAGRGYPNVGDTPAFPYVNTVFNSDPLNNDPANVLVLDALGYEADLDPTFAKNVVNCGDELLIATDPVVISDGVATICATITLVRGAYALSLGNSSVSGVWINLAELNNVGTLSTTGAFTDALGQVQVCITQPVESAYLDVRLQACSEGLWPKKLMPCEGQAQSQVLVDAEGCTICYTLDIPGDNWLPVELASFTATAGAALVNLNWTTASEAGLDRFEIVRDGAVVTTVSARNDAMGATYSFVDNNVEAGVTYSYQLVCLSLNGQRDVMSTASATPRGEQNVVSNFALHQNYPNPFNPETTIGFELAEASNVSLTVFNVAGQQVASLVNGNLNAGTHSVNFNASALTSGIYLYRLTAGSFTAQHKMVLMK
ncbi:MAG: T9SS type A sorting domain-containing protein [bacterium]|nr:T9SS type A sorting domain-containing protein [bacterium]